MTTAGKNLPLVSRCLALIFKQKHSDATVRRGTVPAPEEFVPREIFEEFREMNCMSLWNINMEEAVRNICYVGHLVPFTILIDGDERHLQTLKVGWIKRLLRSPKGFKLEAVGDVLGTVEMACLPQTQFIPLDEALCFIVHDLSCSGVSATLANVRDRLRSWYRDLQMPDEELIVNVLHSLVRDVKLYYTANGYCIMTPDKAHVANWLAAQHNRAQTSAPPTQAPAPAPAPVRNQPTNAQGQLLLRAAASSLPSATMRFNGANGESGEPFAERYARPAGYYQPGALPDGDAQPLYCTHEFVAPPDAEADSQQKCNDAFAAFRAGIPNAPAAGYVTSQMRRLNVNVNVNVRGEPSEKASKDSDREQSKSKSAPKKATSTSTSTSASVLKKLLPDRESKRADETPAQALYQTQPLDVNRSAQTPQNVAAAYASYAAYAGVAGAPPHIAAAYQFAQMQAQNTQQPGRLPQQPAVSDAWNYQQPQPTQVPHQPAQPPNANCAASCHSHSSAANSLGDALSAAASASASASASNHSSSNRVRIPPNAAALALAFATNQCQSQPGVATASSSPACGRHPAAQHAVNAAHGRTKRDFSPACVGETVSHNSQPTASCPCAACVDVHAQLENFRADRAAPPAGPGVVTQPLVPDSGFGSSHHTESNGSAHDANRPPSATTNANDSAVLSSSALYPDSARFADAARCSPSMVASYVHPYAYRLASAQHADVDDSNLPSDHSYPSVSALRPDDADADDSRADAPNESAEFRVMGVV